MNSKEEEREKNKRRRRKRRRGMNEGNKFSKMRQEEEEGYGGS